PLLHQGQAIGVLKVTSLEPCRYSPADVRTMEMMATLVGAVLGHAIRHEDTAKEYERRLASQRGRAAERAAEAARLDAVLREESVKLVYQPLLRLSDGLIVGYEALCRFPGPERRSPMRWFTDAAGVGRTQELEMLAARKALEALVRMPPPLRLL